MFLKATAIHLVVSLILFVVLSIFPQPVNDGVIIGIVFKTFQAARTVLFLPIDLIQEATSQNLLSLSGRKVFGFILCNSVLWGGMVSLVMRVVKLPVFQVE